MTFTWYDSYTKEKKVTTNPMSERVSMLYNLAIMYNLLVYIVFDFIGNKLINVSG